MQVNMDEFDFIDRIKAQAHQLSDPGVILGIGDDAAAIRLNTDRECIVAADMLMEGVHFDFASATAAQVGRKGLAVNLSDLAAMAAVPRYALITIAAKRGSSQIDEMMQGVLELAKQFDVALIGGDTNAWNGPCVLSVTVIGEATERGTVTRYGAHVGDAIYVTGELGGSQLGKHLTFQPRVKEALLLHQHLEIHSMIDLSDGLASDLKHILQASEVGAILEQDAVPVSAAATQINDTLSDWEHAIGDGEDFELLFTAAEEAVARLPQQLLSTPLFKIGEIVAGTGVLYRDRLGNQQPLPKSGWHHKL